MKKYFIALCLLLATLDLQAQFSLIRGDRINLTIDYTQATISGLTFDEFVAMQNGEDQKWESVEGEWRMKFLGEANDILQRRNLYIGSFKDAKLTLIITINTINRHGDINCHLNFKTNKGEFLINYDNNMSVDGGTWGSLVNLIGDGHESLGEAVGKYIKRNFEIRY